MRLLPIRAAAVILGPLSLLLGGCATSSSPPSDGQRAGRPGVVRAADGTPLEAVPEVRDLQRHLRRTSARQLRRGDLRSGIRPQLLRALIDELRGVRGAGVVVDVADGRLLAAAGSGGVSPWRTLQPPGSTLEQHGVR